MPETKEMKTNLILKPAPGKVVVRRLERVTKVGNILIPDTAQKKHNKAVIIAVGEPKEGEHEWLSVGQRILFNDYGFGHFPDDEMIAIVGYNDILCEIVSE